MRNAAIAHVWWCYKLTQVTQKINSIKPRLYLDDMSRDSKLKQGQEEGRETCVEQELSPRNVPCVIPVNSDAGMFSMFLQERVNLEHA